jgi:hypothetical protein
VRWQVVFGAVGYKLFAVSESCHRSFHSRIAVGGGGDSGRDVRNISTASSRYAIHLHHPPPFSSVSASRWATDLQNISLLCRTHVHRKRGLDPIGEEPSVVFARYGKHCWSLSSYSKPSCSSAWRSPGGARPMLLASVLTESHCSIVRALFSSSCEAGS